MKGRIGTAALTLAVVIGPGGAAAQDVPSAAPTPERPNGGYYEDRWLCPDDIPVAARRGTMRVESAGRTVDVIVYTPTGRLNGAVIVMLHGARGLGSTLPVFDPRALQLASRGYVVATPQYYDVTRGDTGRGGRNMDLWRDLSNDVAAALARVPGVDAARVGVWGFSLGGWLSVEGAMRHASLRSAVGVATGTDVAPAASTRRAIPVLMVNARGDPVVSARSGRDLAESLRRRGAEVDARVLDSREHLFEQPLQCQTFTWTREFFDRTLSAP